MVGYDAARPVKLSSLEYGVAGATAGGCTRLFTQPLDVLKIRFQLQLEPISKWSCHSKYRGVVQAMTVIIQEEGVTALWKGHMSAQLLSCVYGAVEFATFEAVTKTLTPMVPDSVSKEFLKPVVHFVSGTVAGSTATVICQPFDVLRTRFVAQGEPKIYRNYLQACIAMYSTEGARSFYKGLVPSLLQIAPYSGMQFGFYSVFRLIWKTILEPVCQKVYFKENLEAMVCGSTAGVCAKMAVYPLDLLKKRLQVQGFEEARRPFGETGQYRGLLDCLVGVVRREGVHSLYKGAMPSVMKAALSTGLHFSVYEGVCRLLVLRHNDS